MEINHKYSNQSETTNYTIVKACVPDNCELLVAIAYLSYDSAGKDQELSKLFVTSKVEYLIWVLVIVAILVHIISIYMYYWAKI